MLRYAGAVAGVVGVLVECSFGVHFFASGIEFSSKILRDVVLRREIVSDLGLAQIGFAHLRMALDVLRRVLDQRRALSENGNPLGQ